MTCPHCKQELTPSQIASLMGAIKTDKKSKSSALNGKKGGRPKKNKHVREN